MRTIPSSTHRRPLRRSRRGRVLKSSALLVVRWGRPERRPQPPARAIQGRRGFLTPAIAIALLVVMAAVALVLDHLWLDSASIELSGAADAAALAAAAQLAGDDTLRDPTDWTAITTRARRAAVRVASRNLVVGQPLLLDAPDDVRFGRAVTQRNGRTVFLETNQAPTMVAVIGQRTRSRNNPVALLFRSLTGEPAGDVVAWAEATVDSRLIGLRPFKDAPIPALPMAIWKADPQGFRKDTWDVQIGLRQGPDEYTYNPITRRTLKRPDGIPEILLKTAARDESADEVNVQFVNVANCAMLPVRGSNVVGPQIAPISFASHRAQGTTRIGSRSLIRQFAQGWTAADLRSLKGELRIDQQDYELSGTASADYAIENALGQLDGACRICLLYSETADRSRETTVRCVGFVAGRVLAVRRGENAALEIVFQPGVITTRTAVVAPLGPRRDSVPANPYIYKLQLTQ